MTQEERAADAAELFAHGKSAMDFLEDGKPALYDLLVSRGEDCTSDELSAIYTGLKGMSADSSLAQFDKELKAQLRADLESMRGTL